MDFGYTQQKERTMHYYTRLCLLAFLLLLTGCSTAPVQFPNHAAPVNQVLTARYYQVRIPVRNGLILTATVYQPALAANEEAPLVIHTHGLAGFRAPRPLSIYGKVMLSGIAAIDAWKNGYWVISYDQRGWGNSDGKAGFMDADKEVADVSAVIDWATRNLPRLRMQAEDDPYVGMVGESWGAGVQMLASAHDKRLDALVPMAGWHNLSSSVAPNGVMKTAWGMIMLGFGELSSFFDMGEMASGPVLRSASGLLSPAADERMRRNSPISYCEQGLLPHADVLLISGFRDSLFPLNDALNNQRCFRQSGRDIRLLGIQNGHLLLDQRIGFPPLFHMETTLHCDNATLDVRAAIQRWWGEKLKGIPHLADDIPTRCLSLDFKHGIVSNHETDAIIEHTAAAPAFTFNDTVIHAGTSGHLEYLLRPIDALTKAFSGAPDAKDFNTDQHQGGGIRPAFIPLTIIREPQILAGIPYANLQFAHDSKRAPLFYIGIGIKRANSRKVRLLNEQHMPFRPVQQQQQWQGELAAVATQLQAGDVIGLLVSGVSDHYLLNFKQNWWPLHTTLKGAVQLPLWPETKDIEKVSAAGPR